MIANEHGETLTLPILHVSPPRIDVELAQRIRMVGLDVDGVLTDGGVYLGAMQAPGESHSAAPFELKRYDIQDGLGIQLLRDCGIVVVVVTGRVSASVAQRAAELRVDAVVQDPHARKLPTMLGLVQQFGCVMDDVAFIGDDLPDLAVLREVGLPVAVHNAVPEVRRAARLRLNKSGGYGAVREFVEALLTARGEWTDAVERYVASRRTLATENERATG